LNFRPFAGAFKWMGIMGTTPSSSYYYYYYYYYYNFN